jgi:hypothetical protein
LPRTPHCETPPNSRSPSLGWRGTESSKLRLMHVQRFERFYQKPGTNGNANKPKADDSMEATTLARVYALSLPHVKRKLSRQLRQGD